MRALQSRSPGAEKPFPGVALEWVRLRGCIRRGRDRKTRKLRVDTAQSPGLGRCLLASVAGQKENVRARKADEARKPLRSESLLPSRAKTRKARGRGEGCRPAAVHLLLLAVLILPFPGLASPKERSQTSGSEGLEVVLEAPEADVFHAVEHVANDEIVHGTYVYEKEKTLRGAVAETSSAYFGRWQGPGKALYKVLNGALAPRHFKNSADVGTIAVRYLVQAVNASRTRVHIEAVFVEEGKRKVHLSDGSVESSEMKEIQDQLQQIKLEEERAAEALKHHQEQEASDAALARQREAEKSRLLAAESAAQSLEERVSALRHEAVRLVNGPGVDLKSGPFHGAVTLQPLPANTEVVILIVTPYWLGVETPEGHRGWVRRDQVKQLP